MKMLISLCRSALHLRCFDTVLLLAWLISLSCQKKPTAPEPDDPVRTDTQLQVTSYVLPKGETQEFPAGFEIVASEGIEIAGDLVIKPSRPGDFTLRAVSGDIHISGRVMVQKDSVSATTGKTILEKNSALNKSAAQQGVRLFFILDRPGATISLGRGAQIQSGDGRNAQEALIVSWEGKFVGDVGAPAGDIIIRAGKIILPDLQPGDSPLFVLGNGGHGAKIKVDRENFNTTGSNLELIGGRGGDSGILMLEADTIEGMPAVDQLDAELLAGGVGGNGGNVLWDNAEIARFAGYTAALKKTYPLQEITLRGDDGGNGATTGGKGGLAAYWSARVINERGDPIAAVAVTGGDGGDVFPSPLPVGLVQGGEGAEYIVIGNNGWEGVPPDSADGSIHGAEGGDVVGRGGNGGDILEGVLFQSAIGGDGGYSEIAQTRVLTELPVLYQIFGFQGPNYAVISGSGGEGADRADGCAGGNGGSSGTVLAIGGNGGNVPNRAGARGGRGGDVWTAWNWFPPFEGASGGNGNPPGKGGCIKTVATSPGEGGAGFLRGNDGQELGLPESDQERCGPDGELSGAGVTCAEDSSGGQPDCWKLGSTFTAYFEQADVCVRNGQMQTTTRSWNENVTFVENGLQVEGTFVYHFQSFNGETQDTTYSYEDVAGAIAALHNWRVVYPFCYTCDLRDEFELYFPGGDFTYACTRGNCTTTYVFRFNGCNPVLFERDNPGDWRCCNGQATYTGGAECP